MRDLSQLTDAELEKIAAPQLDISQLSDEQLEAISNQGKVEPKKEGIPTWAKAALAIPAVVEGAKQGLRQVGQGAKQIYLKGTEGLGFQPEGTAADYTKQVQTQRDDFDKKNVLNILMPTATGYGKFIGETAPYVAVPGGVAGGLLRRLGTGMAAGAGIGASQFVPEGGSRTFNTVTGAALGGLIPGLGAAGSAGYNFLRRKPSTDMLKGVDENVAMDTLAAARRLDPELNLSPAEASGSTLAARREGKLGTSEKGSQIQQAAGQSRIQTEKNIINNFLNDLSPDGSSAALEIRSAAKKALSDKEFALANSAKPLYQKAHAQEIPEPALKNLMEDGIISRAHNSIAKNPIYSNEIKGVNPNSVKYLDLAKRQIDDEISSAKRSGEKNAVRLLEESKNRLVKALDEVSPDYKAARILYSEGAKPLQKLREGNIGRIAELNDVQLKNVSKIIFDPNQTDVKVLNELRKEITSKNPDAWNRIIRNEMERRMSLTKGDISGSKFYNQILGRERDFQMFLSASKDMPGATQKLIDMRKAFKNLINPMSTKTAASQAKSSLVAPRNTLDAVRTQASNLLGGKYDQAAVNFITSGKWDREFASIKKIKDSSQRVQELTALLSKIAVLEATENNNQIFQEK
jgi:hypothetical protein